MNDERPKIGVYDPYLFELGGGERYVGIFAETLQHNYNVEIISHDSTSLSEIERRFQLDLGDVTKRELPPNSSAPHDEGTKAWLRSLYVDRKQDRERAQFTADYDVFINLSNSIPNYCLADHGILLLQMPYIEGDRRRKENTWRSRVRSHVLGSHLTMEEVLKLRSYERKVANSEFTKRWIRRLWNVDSDVIYTGLDTSIFLPAEKRNIILAVGRFQPAIFCKNQHVLVECFKQMCDEGMAGWEFHLAGGVSEKAEEREYLQRVCAAAEGYPVVIHANAGFDELRKSYSRARIFWHATGFGEDEEKAPWRMEHFGLTTVEAMAAGCVPIVINRGGQPEIVTDGTDGFLWNDLDELKLRTRQVINSPELEKKLRIMAADTSTRFDKSIFQRNIRAVVGSMKPSYDEVFA
jgi:glycosyltransferase involved in cell wall biosynthesis